jgi:predicted transcriptional regulator
MGKTGDLGGGREDAGKNARVGDGLSRREREIMDALYRAGEASAHDIRRVMSSPPSYSAVRALLAVMTEKGLIRHRKESRRYLYRPAVSEKKAKHSALRRLLGTFFDDSPEKLVAALLDPADPQLNDEEIDRIRKLINTRKS